jgi:hypothetical protein
VREHVDGDAAPVGGAVVPRRPLRGLPVPLEHPVAELPAHGQDPAEEPAADQPVELADARQEELVLHHAVPDPGGVGQPGQPHRGLGAGGHGLLRVDVLAGLDGELHRLLPGGGDLRVEVDVHVRTGQGGGQIGGPVGQAVPARERAEPALVPADQYRLGPQHGAVPKWQATLLAQGQHGPHQVLAVAHPAGHSVQRDPHDGTGHG